MPAISGGKAAHDLYRDEELGPTLTTKALDWMRKHKDAPFFLYFATPQIHHPFTPGPQFKCSSEASRYGDHIQEFDWMVGGQDAWKAGHRLNSNLLGFKFDAWEGGHRVPFIACWPGKAIS